MAHVALLAQLWSWRRRWKLHLQPTNERLRGYIESIEPQGFGFDIALPDEDSILVANAMVQGGLAPGVLALPSTYDFFSAVEEGSPIPATMNVLANSVFYDFGGVAVIEPRSIAAGAETRFVTAKQMAAMLP